MAAHESGLQDAEVMEMSVSEQWGDSFSVPCLCPDQHRGVVAIATTCPMSLHEIPPLACASHQQRCRDSDTPK